MAAVFTLFAQHLGDIGARLSDRDAGDGEGAMMVAGGGEPVVDVGLTAVVGGEGEELAAVVEVEQVAQVVGAIGDVDRGVPRSETLNAYPCERRARNSAVAGSICIRPSAPVGEVRGRKRVSA